MYYKKYALCSSGVSVYENTWFIVQNTVDGWMYGQNTIGGVINHCFQENDYERSFRVIYLLILVLYSVPICLQLHQKNTCTNKYDLV